MNSSGTEFTFMHLADVFISIVFHKYVHSFLGSQTTERGVVSTML